MIHHYSLPVSNCSHLSYLLLLLLRLFPLLVLVLSSSPSFSTSPPPLSNPYSPFPSSPFPSLLLLLLFKLFYSYLNNDVEATDDFDEYSAKEMGKKVRRNMSCETMRDLAYSEI